MKYLEKNPMIMIAVGVFGISLSSIFVKYSTAPSAVTAAWRLLWTVALMTPTVLLDPRVRGEFRKISRKDALISILSGLFLAAHFATWFESLVHTSVASSTTIVCTEVIWVSLGYCLFLKGRLSGKAVAAITVTVAGSALIALADSASGDSLRGDALALAAAVTVAVYVLLGRVVRERVSTTVYTYLVYISCAMALLVLCLKNRASLLGYGFSAPVVGLLLAVFSTILGHSVFSWCLKYFSPSFVSASKLCEPVVAAVLAAVLFGEIPGPLALLGGCLILGGVLWYSRLESLRERNTGPLIALPDTGTGLFHRYMIKKYEAELIRAGARVLWIRPAEVSRALTCDGLLLPGGDDVDPSFYGREKTALCGRTDPQRDQDEWALLEAFLATGKPFLGICRGEQMLNVFRGGTLHQDIKGSQKVKHSDYLHKNRGNHLVSLAPGSRLQAIFGSAEIRVNSLHHQAAEVPAPGLSVAGRSEDGFIEALEDPSHPFCVAVQWHPEHMGRTEQRKLFTAFVEAAAPKE